MLFKRKSGSNSPTGQHAGPSDKESARGDHRAPEQSSSDRPVHADWDDKTRQDMASLFNKPDRRETPGEAGYAMTQRGETQKERGILVKINKKNSVMTMMNTGYLNDTSCLGFFNPER